MEHYLDNSATTKVSENSARKAIEIMCEKYANPSSLHSFGMEAEKELEKAREIISREIGCESEEVFFTSGGTESNNLAVIGSCLAKKRSGHKIVTTAIEHSSVIEAMEHLEKEGFQVEYLKPNENGVVTTQQIEQAVDENTILVSIMCVNNEIGSIMEIDKIRKILQRKKSSALIHTDAVQAFGKISLKVKKLSVDLMTVSSHKVHGPKGVGTLYIKKGVRILPIHFGGEQEKKIRPGTEALPLIGAFGTAVSEFCIDKNYKYVKELNDYAIEKLRKIPSVYINSSENALPYIINISVDKIRSETMLHFLAQKGVYVSSGSACAKGKPSHVLSSLGLDRNRADSALRISFSDYNTKNDIDALCNALDEGIDTLVKKS